MYESPVLQRSVGVDLGAVPALDETAICRVRHLFEKHDRCGMMHDAANIHLGAKGIKIATGVFHARKRDATIMHAPMSMENACGESDLEMHQTKKRRRATSGTSD